MIFGKFFVQKVLFNKMKQVMLINIITLKFAQSHTVIRLCFLVI